MCGFRAPQAYFGQPLFPLVRFQQAMLKMLDYEIFVSEEEIRDHYQHVRIYDEEVAWCDKYIFCSFLSRCFQSDAHFGCLCNVKTPTQPFFFVYFSSLTTALDAISAAITPELKSRSI
jgi:hypothetical protein